jgi:hypothetical protein
MEVVKAVLVALAIEVIIGVTIAAFLLLPHF